MRIEFNILLAGVYLNERNYVTSISDYFYEVDEELGAPYVSKTTKTKIGPSERVIFHNTSRNLINEFKKINLPIKSFKDFMNDLDKVYDHHKNLLDDIKKIFGTYPSLEYRGSKLIKVLIPTDEKVRNEYISYLEGLDNEYLTDLIKELKTFVY